MQFVLLILGLAMIIKSADVLIDSSSKIAGKFGVSTFIIGITVVAFGTSAPELAVGIVSGISKTNQLTLGNIIGSSLSNIALIVGLAATIFPLQVKDTVVKRELPMLMVIELVLAGMLYLCGGLSRISGLALLFGFLLFMVYIAYNAKHSMQIQLDAEGDIDTDGDGNNLGAEAHEKKKNTKMSKLIFLSIISLAGLFIGGKITVDSSSQIAQSFGLSETLIGLTVVAIATTMPELITSIMAVIKKEPDIVLGNCIGSNIFNILFVLGVSSTIHPILTENSLWFDIICMLAVTFFVYVISISAKKINRATGIILLVGYVSYLLFKTIPVLLAQ